MRADEDDRRGRVAQEGERGGVGFKAGEGAQFFFAEVPRHAGFDDAAADAFGVFAQEAGAGGVIQFGVGEAQVGFADFAAVRHEAVEQAAEGAADGHA